MVKVRSSDLLLNNTLTPPLTQQKKMGITGSIGMWVGSSPPAGALFCDGQEYNSSTNPQLLPLAIKLGVLTPGVFNVPNLQGRLPRGINSIIPRTTPGGNKQIQSIGHTHTINQNRFAIPNATSRPEVDGDSEKYVYPLENIQTTAVTTTNNAVGAKIDYLPSYLAVNFIIYT
jgi:microcystin-dependent protein